MNAKPEWTEERAEAHAAKMRKFWEDKKKGNVLPTFNPERHMHGKECVKCTYTLRYAKTGNCVYCDGQRGKKRLKIAESKDDNADAPPLTQQMAMVLYRKWC